MCHLLVPLSPNLTIINQFLVTEAYDFDIGNLAKTFVYLQDNVVVGFFTTLASLTTIKNTYRKEKKIITNGASNYPVIDIVYFAIDKHYQRKQLGSALMKTLLTMLYENVITHTGVALVTVQALGPAVPFIPEILVLKDTPPEILEVNKKWR